MSKYIAKRIVMMIPVLIGVLMIVFTLSRLTPGDPAKMLAGDEATEADVQRLREELGLDKPIYIQFINYIKNLVTRGDLGISYQTKRPVSIEIFERLPTTALLATLSVILSISIGIPAGILSATRKYSLIDNVSMGIALVGVSMPSFWQGLMSILIFSVHLKWLPASGFYGWQYWILPTITVGTGSAAIIARMTRSSMLEVIGQDYIRTARAKGQTERRVVMQHALKNALIPIITVIGIQFGGLLGGAVLTETVYAIPGLGKFMVDSIKSRNYPAIQGGVLILAVIFSFINLLVDILYAFADPRIKSMYQGGKKRKKAEAPAALADS